jgi:hypothetical protein
MKHPMDITVVIPTVGRVETLSTVLTAISFQKSSLILEIILLDEAKMPVMENYVVNQALDVLSLKNIKVKVIRNRNRRGIGAARQLLVEEAKTNYVLMVDDDVVLTPGCLEYLSQGIEEFPWAVPTCRLIPAAFTDEGYIDTEIVSPEDPRVLQFTQKYPWYVPYFRYPVDYKVVVPYSGTQAILLKRKSFLSVNSDLADLGQLPREDSVMTSRMGEGIFIAAAETLHYEHQSQLGRGNWSSSVHYRLHQAAALDPDAFVKLMSLKGNRVGDVVGPKSVKDTIQVKFSKE